MTIISTLFLGVKYMDECPVEPRIPLYLFVGGCFTFLKMLTILWHHLRSRRGDSDDADLYVADAYTAEVITTSRSSKLSHFILTLFNVIWFFLGNVWVFRVYPPHFEQILHDPSNWCDKNMYIFTVVNIILIYIGSVALVAVVAFINVYNKCMDCLGKYDDDDDF